jgi:signal transduction histidine kinase
MLIACGLLARARRPESLVGFLLTLTGFAWFLGTLSGSRVGVISAVGTALVFLHRGPLFHAIIAYPGGRPSGRLSLALVVLCYVYAAVMPLAFSSAASIVVAVLVLAVTIWGYARSTGPLRRARRTSVAAAAVLAVPLVGGSVLRLTGASSGLLGGYEAAVVLVGLAFLVDTLGAGWSQGAVTKLVVDLGGDAEEGTLRARLARALGDRSLVVGYRLPGGAEYADEWGNVVELPAAGSGKAVTVVEHGGEPIAVLVHDAAVLTDPGLADSVARAARIALSNAQLQAEVRRQVAELGTSRRRILAAGDSQRQRFQLQLQASTGRRLARAVELLAEAAHEASAFQDPATARALADVGRQVEEAQAELRELAAGMHPALLAERGLGPALASLADRSHVPVQLVVTGERLPTVIETAVYFVCSEALANVVKHAKAASVEMRVRLDDAVVRVSIVDDGTGGAEPSSGSGLKGVADRVEALGGWLQVESPPERGTRLLAEIPVAPSERGTRYPSEASGALS